MKKDLPNLAFVYIDTYREHRSIANFTAQHFKKMDGQSGRKIPKYFTGKRYGRITLLKRRVLFLDLFSTNFVMVMPLILYLLGGYSRGAEIGFMGWQKGRDFKGVLHNFFTQQLPYRYLMYHGLKTIDDQKALFEAGLVSESLEGVNKLTQNGHLIKEGDKIFIPWNPITKEKIYHYNTQGGESTWTLPQSWKSSGTVSLYRLTDQGRQWVTDLPINDKREISINADPKQGYVLYQNKIADAAQPKWGDGGLISNPGFDGGLAGWTVKGKDVQIQKTILWTRRFRNER